MMAGALRAAAGVSGCLARRPLAVWPAATTGPPTEGYIKLVLLTRSRTAACWHAANNHMQVCKLCRASPMRRLPQVIQAQL